MSAAEYASCVPELIHWTANTPLCSLKGWTLNEACEITGLTANELLGTDGTAWYPENPDFDEYWINTHEKW